MVLEAVMLLVDNSESSRNGDYPPTRFDSQVDAVNIIFQSITQGNPESSVGLMSMGGKGPEVLSTLTTDQGKILDGLHRTKKKIGGSSHLKTGIQVATLALKHRQNRLQRQRIIAFVCSPVGDEEKELTQLAKKMRKANIFVDFVLFGDLEDEDTKKKLVAFNDLVKVNDGSHLVSIPASSKLLSDQLITSPILLGEGAGGAGGAAGLGGNEDFEFGVDPALEPELALALRMSLEEENARQEKKAREQEQASGKTPLESVEEENEGSGSGSKGDKKDDDKKDDDKKDDDKMDTS